MELNRSRAVNENKPIFFFFFFFLIFMIFILLWLCSMSITCSSADSENRRRCSSAEAGHARIQHCQPIANCATWALKVVGDHEDQELTLPRRGLGGPGSSPPRCASKCGKCTPCTAVHVPVPPGTPVTAEYYPEAWRCKCGNKLYRP